MNQQLLSQEEFLRVLTKGMITLPKSWREELQIQEGTFIKAKKIVNKIIIEPIQKPVPYRIYSQKELKQFLKDDKLSKKEMDKIKKKLDL